MGAPKGRFALARPRAWPTSLGLFPKHYSSVNGYRVSDILVGLWDPFVQHTLSGILVLCQESTCIEGG